MAQVLPGAADDALPFELEEGGVRIPRGWERVAALRSACVRSVETSVDMAHLPFQQTVSVPRAARAWLARRAAHADVRGGSPASYCCLLGLASAVPVLLLVSDDGIRLELAEKTVLLGGANLRYPTL